MKYKNILFDLDGTLTDPKVGITKGVQYALACFDIEEPDLDKLTPFIGPPLVNSFKEFYGMSDDEAWEAREAYREYFGETGIYENKLYEGIAPLLCSLKEKGYCLVVASSKPRLYVKRSLSYFRIMRYFDIVEGSEMDGKHTDKAQLIAHLLEKWNLKADECVMVGDRKYDVEGAKANGMDSIAVGYGYGSEDELSGAGPTHFFSTIEELKNFFLN